MAQLTSLFVARDSSIHRLNPLTKLTITGFLLVCGLALPGFWTNYLLFLLLIIPLAAMAGVLKPLLATSWKIVLPFAISVFLIQGFLWPQGTPVLKIGPLSLKEEGLAFAVVSTGRILLIVSSFLWFALTTRPDHLMNSLSTIGFPANLAYVIVTTIQIAPRFQARADHHPGCPTCQRVGNRRRISSQGACLSPIGYPFSSQQPGRCRGTCPGYRGARVQPFGR